MARANYVKAARKDIPGTDIKAGDSYYWWKFRYGGKRYSKTYPKRSELTQSAFYSQLYDLEDRISDFSPSGADDFNSFKEEIKDEIEEMKSQCEESLENIPESLREGNSGTLLQERIDALDEWYNDIDNVEDCEIDEDEIRQDILDEHEDDEEWTEADTEDEIEYRINQILSEKLDELRDATYNG